VKQQFSVFLFSATNPNLFNRAKSPIQRSGDTSNLKNTNIIPKCKSFYYLDIQTNKSSYAD